MVGSGVQGIGYVCLREGDLPKVEIALMSDQVL